MTGSLLQNSIKIRRIGDDTEGSPGFMETDTIAHCDLTLKCESARTLDMTDMLTGWTFTISIRNNTSTHIIADLDTALETVPFPITDLGFDNSSAFIWSAGRSSDCACLCVMLRLRSSVVRARPRSEYGSRARMKPFVTVCQLYPGRDSPDGALSCGIYHTVHSFVLQRGVERLGSRVVPADGSPTYGRTDTVLRQTRGELIRRILRLTVRVKDRHAPSAGTVPHRHVDRILRQRNLDDDLLADRVDH